MKRLRNIFVILLILHAVSCSDFRYLPEVRVPEITSLFSEPDINSVTLTSSLSDEGSVKIKCGFYLGRDAKTLTQYFGTVSDNEFSSTIKNLDEGTTYWYKAFVTNGINEICTSLQSFSTLKAPEPEPDDQGGTDEPEPGPDNPGGTDEPIPPVTEPDPDEPEPEPELTVSFGTVTFRSGDDILELNASLSGDLQRITEVWFDFGNSPENLSFKLQASLEGNIIKAYTTLLAPGSYWIKASVTDGTTVISSEITEIIIEEPAPPVVEPEPGPNNPGGTDEPIPPVTEPDPDEPEPGPTPPVEFAAEIGSISMIKSGDMVEIRAELSGDVGRIKEAYFYVGFTQDRLSKIAAIVDGNVMTAYMMGLPDGNYWVKATISDGDTVKETEVKPLNLNVV